MELFNVDIVTQLSRCEIVAMQVSRAIPIVLTVRKLDCCRSKLSFWTPWHGRRSYMVGMADHVTEQHA